MSSRLRKLSTFDFSRVEILFDVFKMFSNCHIAVLTNATILLKKICKLP